jgi:hypothetical protein
MHPSLESLHAVADVPQPSAFPKRFGIIFLGNGINEDHWSAEMKLGKTLSPFEPLKQKTNVIDGLYVYALRGREFIPPRPAVCYPARTYRKAPSSAAEKLVLYQGTTLSRAVK